MSTDRLVSDSPQWRQVRELFAENFEDTAPALAAIAPGRSEIAGNHTDHEGGQVIAGALDVDVCALVAPNGSQRVRLVDASYGRVELELDSLKAREDEHVSTAGLIRGMAAELAATGRTPQGFDLACVSSIPAGGGLSSSAAVEALLGRVMEALWEGPSVDAVELARMSQRTENAYFGKPCGLMDQLAVCLGGLAHMSFADPAAPAAEKLAFSFDACGYALCLVDVGCDHAPFTADYAAVPTEMQQVAREFGRERLLDVDETAFDAALPQLREKLGDRAVLRAIHFWHENRLVERRWDALQAGDIDAFLSLTRDSGASSAMFLQNVSSGGSFQPAMYALGLAERVLEGRGAIRIHGGGFGGSIQCFVPLELVDEFTEKLNGWLGEGAVRHYQIAEEGARAAWL